MYLADYSDPRAVQLHGLGSKLKKAVKKVTGTITKPLQAVHRKVEAKLVPEKLMPIASRLHKSIERGTAIALNPVDAPRLLKEEVRQIQEARKDPKFTSLVAKIVAVVALVYPFLQPIAAAMSAINVAAERAAAKQLMAKDAAEAAAAQAEFDAYVKELAELQQQYAAMQAKPVGASPSSSPLVAQPVLPVSQPLSPVYEAGMFDREEGVRAAGTQPAALPTWAVPAAIGAAALLALPLLTRRKGH